MQQLNGSLWENEMTDEIEQAEVLEKFEAIVADITLPFDDLTSNGKVLKLMYKMFCEGYKFGVYK